MPIRLPDKIKSDPEGSLVFFGHTDVGTLNNVVELWRYPSAQVSHCYKNSCHDVLNHTSLALVYQYTDDLNAIRCRTDVGILDNVAELWQYPSAQVSHCSVN